MAATKEQKELKTNAEDLLAFNGKDYDDWLEEKHREVVSENIPLLMNLLKKERKAANTGTALQNS
ncbi:hypothetical protein FQ085_14830 [Planococcus sp. ANT_H30]|uniref:hypothetical protein n=1 Tax=Planococcus sp. ANT_H30 TaxID=2597347 RepID=UPI0011EBFFBB|nr:hypothetical protein [Planococcus sp. ANT_H30]KAA0956116.1 hypothetical protein FQ085_14830 [Planococcus sp. ANT_H30]